VAKPRAESMNAIEAALEAAAIPMVRRGGERAKRLTAGERSLYQWMLRSFAAGAPPSPDTLVEAASSFEVDVEVALATLAREDLAHYDPTTGTILVAYPFSGRPRGHRVLIDGEHRAEAMCAIDALGIAPMLNLPIEINSRDPCTGSEIWVRLDPGDGAWWEPGTAVVLAGSSCCDAPSFRGCCDVLNYFESHASAERHLREHAELAGLPISIPDAIEVGRTVFADLIKEP